MTILELILDIPALLTSVRASNLHFKIIIFASKGMFGEVFVH